MDDKMDTIELTKLIHATLRIKHGDSLPMTGFNHRVTRQDLAKLMARAGFTHGAEIGVQRGYHAQTLLANNPDLRLLCVDPWHAYNRITQDMADTRYAKCVNRLSQFGPRARIIRRTSMEAVADVPDALLDFVYIDGLHEFDPVMMDLICWEKKVRVGGIVAGHDYLEFYQGGVVDAVRAYTAAHRITDWYVIREKNPSWFWVKQQ